MPKPLYDPPPSQGHFDFLWRRSKGGYEWIDRLELRRPRRYISHPNSSMLNHNSVEHCELSPPPYLRAKASTKGSQVYEPMGFRNLHRVFSRVSPDPEGIAKFARYFGMLGRAAWTAWVPGEKDECLVESLAVWQKSISQMRTLIALSDALTMSDTKGRGIIESILNVKDPSHGFIRSEWQEQNPGCFQDGPDSLAFLLAPSYDPFDLARTFLAEQVNRELLEAVSPMIVAEKGAAFLLAPRDLLGAAYTQLALEVVGHTRPPIPCPNCGRFFQQTQRNNRYCSASCKQRVYERNKAQKKQADESNDNG